MTIDELYNELIKKYPQYVNYIKCKKKRIYVFITDNPKDQKNSSIFFIVKKLNRNIELYRRTGSAQDFSAPAEFNVFDPYNYTSAEERITISTFPDALSLLIDYGPDYEVAVHYFDKLSMELPKVCDQLRSCGFNIGGVGDGFVSMGLGAGYSCVTVEFPCLDHLTYYLSMSDAKGWNVLWCESKNIDDCMEYLTKEN